MDKDIMPQASAEEMGFGEDELRLIYKGYSAFSRVPTYNELEAFRRVLKERELKAEGCVFSSVVTDSTSVAQTYDDLCQKAVAMKGKAALPLSFEETAYVLGDYTEMIGRRDASFVIAGSADASEELAFDENGRAVFAIGQHRLAERGRRRAELKGENTAIYFLDDSGADSVGGSISMLFSDTGFRNLPKAVIRIDEYGILGAICGISGLRGAEVDIGRLPHGDEDICPVKSFRGKYIVVLSRQNIGPLTFLTGRYGIQPIYFAYPTASRCISVFTGSMFGFPIDTLRELMSGRHTVTPTVGMSDRIYGQSKLSVCRVGEHLTVTDTVRGKEGFFGAVDRVVSLVLSLVSRGVDRRAVCLALEYTLKRDTNDASADIGEALGLCLGAYRVGIELASPVGVTHTVYGKADTSMCCMAYAVDPYRAANDGKYGSDAALYFLPVARGDDSLIDFSDLRRVCDKFTDIYRDGGVVRAAAVTAGGLGVAIKEVVGANDFVASDVLPTVRATDAIGIVFVCSGTADAVLLGSVSENKDFS